MKKVTLYVRDSDSPYEFDEKLEQTILSNLTKREDIYIFDPDTQDFVFIPFHAITSVEYGDVET